MDDAEHLDSAFVPLRDGILTLRGVNRTVGYRVSEDRGDGMYYVAELVASP
ncbi:hypothetical protein [Actinomadura alba]|uniref:Uncharacterized protein n=1 Tax=Actinomadura alba TaxID=406431 RepID=A0ABR7M2P1_9ACTN|nr:hypothetical protein [Actinomadura alba]MBC6471183.1 hypothetical protein [Actinomadura alba]